MKMAQQNTAVLSTWRSVKLTDFARQHPARRIRRRRLPSRYYYQPQTSDSGELHPYISWVCLINSRGTCTSEENDLRPLLLNHRQGYACSSRSRPRAIDFWSILLSKPLVFWGAEHSHSSDTRSVLCRGERYFSEIYSSRGHKNTDRYSRYSSQEWLPKQVGNHLILFKLNSRNA